jgi:hypothetical protein
MVFCSDKAALQGHDALQAPMHGTRHERTSSGVAPQASNRALPICALTVHDVAYEHG